MLCGRTCVAVLWRRPCPFTVGAAAKVLRMRGESAGLGASVCLGPALWVVPGTRQWGLAQSQVGTTPL